MKTSTHDLDAETEAFAKKVKELFLLQDLDHSSRQSRWHSVMAMILHIHHDESSPRENSGLPVLDLSGNELEDAEAEKLADALKENANALVPMRWYIKLQDSQIGDAGAAALAAALKQKVSVQNLHLQYNRIGDAGTAALADALKVARQIGEDGGVSPETRGGAPMVLKANASLQVLHLGNNHIGDAGVGGVGSCAEGRCLGAGVDSLGQPDRRHGDGGLGGSAEGKWLSAGFVSWQQSDLVQRGRGACCGTEGEFLAAGAGAVGQPDWRHWGQGTGCCSEGKWLTAEVGTWQQPDRGGGSGGADGCAEGECCAAETRDPEQRRGGVFQR